VHHTHFTKLTVGEGSIWLGADSSHGRRWDADWRGIIGAILTTYVSHSVLVPSSGEWSTCKHIIINDQSKSKQV